MIFMGIIFIHDSQAAGLRADIEAYVANDTVHNVFLSGLYL